MQIIFQYLSRDFPHFFAGASLERASTIDRLAGFGNNESVYSDAHLHLDDLLERDPEFFLRMPSPDWRGAVVAHDIEEFNRSEALRRKIPETIAGFGIHPQAPQWDTADFLATLAEQKKIGFIGEAGFDFFGDRPERVRNEENIDRQRRVFEFQLALAAHHGLPLLIHARKAMDLVLGYGKEMRKLPAVIFHGWPGRLQEAESLLGKGIPAYFSFGTPILRGAKHAIETCDGLSADRILSETDAPWQPPAGALWTNPWHIAAVVEVIASRRNMDLEAASLLLRENFIKAFGLKE